MANTSSSINITMSKQKHKKPLCRKLQGFLDVVFSWSLHDILNKDLYKYQVEELPLTFSSTPQYMHSFTYHLYEETHADLLSQLAGIFRAPVSSIYDVQRLPTGGHKEFMYQMTLAGMKYEPKVGDVVALTEVKPKRIDDLDRPNSPFLIAYVTRIIDENSTRVQVLASNVIEFNSFEKKGQTKSFVVYITNLTTNLRIWQALNPSRNMNVIQRTLSFAPPGARNCDKCSNEGEKGVIALNLRQAFNSFKLDKSQEDAVLSCLASKTCCHQSSCTKLIWGPPGTGKTKTVATLLFILLRTKRRTLTCAPTNIAVVGVVKRLLSLLSDHDTGCDTYGYGDIVLFGNEERMKINDDHEELRDVFLDNRIVALSDCLSRWKTCVNDMILFLERPMKERCFFVASKTKKSKSKRTKNKKNEPTLDRNGDANQVTFEEYILNKFNVLGKKLVLCIRNFCTHLPTSVIPLDFAKKMSYAIDLAHKVGESLKGIVARKQSLKEAFNPKVNRPHFVSLRLLKNECLKTLKEIRGVSFIPKSMRQDKLYGFCLRSAVLIFCTASSSIKLCRNGMTPIELVIIDEAAQLKECESLIPLQLPGVRNAVLVGDERQLPSMVQSKICEEAKFGRSLFERLVLLGHKKNLLNVQYRMHPTISLFPNAEFYDGQILDGPNVINRLHANHFLKDGMYGSYSFVNVDSAKEELDKNYSTRNMVEVAVIAELVANLYKESFAKKQTVTVGCISPYKAQVDAIQEKLGDRFNQNANGWSFSVNVRSVDGFQGSEEDVIIFSAVRCNSRGSVGFLSSHERANVALTRARHCLWIVGNKDTLIKSGSVWSTLVYDAEKRGCVYNARDDKHLAQTMVHALVELADFGSLLKSDSILFMEAKWKVYFTKRFLDRIYSITNLNVRKLLVTLLVKLASGWRQLEKNKQKNHNARGLNNMLETNNVDGHLHLVWSVDIANENSLCFQVLKFWDILPLSQLQQSAKCLDTAFGNYTVDTINRCLIKRLERNQVLPMCWPLDLDADPTCALTSQLAKLRLHFDAE